jgi:hypothetical protein
MSKILTFRGQLDGDDAGKSEKINLHTNDGKVGYRIRKFQLIQKTPGALDSEALVKVWKVEPTTTEIALKTLDLSDNRITAVSFYSASTTANVYPEDTTIIVDNEIFNQDIYLTYIDVRTVNDGMNYYLELETVDLDLGEQTVATLKDIRNVVTQ